MKTIRYGRVVISTILLLMIAAALTLCLLPVQAEPLDTYHSDWNLIRDTGSEDGGDLDAVYDLTSEGGFASKGADAFHIVSKDVITTQGGISAGAAWDIVVSGGIDEDDTFSWTLVGWARANGMLQVIANGTGAIGTQAVVIYPGGIADPNAFWADTLVITDSPVLWNTVEVLNSGNDNVAFLHVDIAGLEWLQFIIYDADGSGTEAANLTAFGKRY